MKYLQLQELQHLRMAYVAYNLPPESPVWAPVLAIVVELWAGKQPIILRFYERFLTLLIGI